MNKYENSFENHSNPAFYSTSKSLFIEQSTEKNIISNIQSLKDQISQIFQYYTTFGDR